MDLLGLRSGCNLFEKGVLPVRLFFRSVEVLSLESYS
jgi:hypothetical protein